MNPNLNSALKKDIEEALWRVASLDQSERKELLDLFAEERDFVGVSKTEWLEVIKEARQKNKISEIDYNHLKKMT